MPLRRKLPDVGQVGQAVRRLRLEQLPGKLWLVGERPTDTPSGGEPAAERESSALAAEDGRERPSRRQIIGQLGALAGVSAAAVLAGNRLWQPAGYEASVPTGVRQVRDYRVVLPNEHGVFPAEGLPGGDGAVASGAAANGAARRIAVATSSTDPAELTRRAVAAMGGMPRFVSRGDIVAIKPNIGWDRAPAHAANTNPRVVAEVVRLCFEAGAKNVVVTDASCNDATRSFQHSGIWRAAHALGANVLLPAPHRFRTMRIRGELLDEWPVYTPLIEADKVINIPVAKHHNLTGYTGAMKNWYGVLGGRRNRLHQKIHLSVADLATFMRPSLTILDCTRVLVRNGPQGGNLADARDMHQVVASLDEVAADTYGARLIGATPERIGFLKLGVERKLGRMDLDGLVEV